MRFTWLLVPFSNFTFIYYFLIVDSHSCMPSTRRLVKPLLPYYLEINSIKDENGYIIRCKKIGCICQCPNESINTDIPSHMKSNNNEDMSDNELVDPMNGQRVENIVEVDDTTIL